MKKKKGDALVIVESPAKARTIGKYLGSGYQVEACLGHVRDLLKGKRGDLGVDIAHGFKPSYAVIKSTNPRRDRSKIVKKLKEISDVVDRVYLASDPDREGEAIAWHLAQALELPKGKGRRVVFHEITKLAVRKAFDHTRDIDEHLLDAQKARRVLDRLVGYQISPLLGTTLSAGRVQSVTLRLLVDRETEIAAFQSEAYWTVSADLATAKGEPFQALLVSDKSGDLRTGAEAKGRTLDQEEAERIASSLSGKAFSCTARQAEERTQHPPPPFTTSTLQQQASIRLRFSTKRTMAVAQQLYQGLDVGDGPVGLITYMRTDAVRMGEEALEEARLVVSKAFGASYLPEKARRFKASSNAQEAHEAVRPTSFSLHPDQVAGRLTEEQAKLYRLIWERAVASQMSPARVLSTRLEISADSEGLKFQANGRHILFDGFLKVAGHRQDDEAVLPAVAQGDRLNARALKAEKHETQPPPRYSEAALVKTLEKLGIGRPSTYAPTLDTIQKRGYVVLEKRRFKPTDLGMEVTRKLVQHFPDILDTGFTAQLEESLDAIAEGKAAYAKVLADFYEGFEPALKLAQKTIVREEPLAEKCPECGRGLYKKWGRTGLFIGCSGFADQEKPCKYTRPLAADAPKPTGLTCDLCGGAMLLAKGRFGPYLCCERYAKKECRFTMKLNRQGLPQRKMDPVPSGRDCEKCGKPLVIRVASRGKKGPRPFLSCSGFPKCRAAADLPPELEKEGAEALDRWKGKAEKDRLDLVKWKAFMPTDGGEGSPEDPE